MEYECDHCHWSGTWDVLILETLCPLCRGSVTPRKDDGDSQTRGSRGVQPSVSSPAAPQ